MTSEQATVHRLDTGRSRHCRFSKRARVHHYQLLRVLSDAESMLDLIEFAVTWGELDYSERAVIPPNRWVEFAHAHSWTDADLAERAQPGHGCRDGRTARAPQRRPRSRGR